jgi:hypothetical protein
MLITPVIKNLRHFAPNEKLIITIITNDIIPEGSNLLLARLSPNNLIDWSRVATEMYQFSTETGHDLIEDDISGSTANELAHFLDKFYDKTTPIIYQTFLKSDFPQVSDRHWSSFCNLINDDFPIDRISFLLHSKRF